MPNNNRCVICDEIIPEGWQVCPNCLAAEERLKTKGKKIMISAPCKNCEKRKVFCHSECKEYKVFREEKDKENEKIQKNRQLYNTLKNTEIERGIKIKRRSKR